MEPRRYLDSDTVANWHCRWGWIRTVPVDSKGTQEIIVCSIDAKWIRRIVGKLNCYLHGILLKIKGKPVSRAGHILRTRLKL
jgi:hypothetical protein